MDFEPVRANPHTETKSAGASCDNMRSAPTSSGSDCDWRASVLRATCEHTCCPTRLRDTCYGAVSNSIARLTPQGRGVAEGRSGSGARRTNGGTGARAGPSCSARLAPRCRSQCRFRVQLSGRARDDHERGARSDVRTGAQSGDGCRTGPRPPGSARGFHQGDHRMRRVDLWPLRLRESTSAA